MNARTAQMVALAGAQVQGALGSCPGSEQRCITSVARWVLLRSPFFYNGRSIDVVAKSLGAGVWSITVKERS
jgi:hypothetical protein